MFLIVTVKVIGIGDFHRAATVHGPDLVGSFILMTTITASFILGFSVYASDYTRYLPKRTGKFEVFWRVALGLALSSAWIEILGLAAASALKNEAPMNTLRDLVGGGLIGALAMLAVAGGTVAINAVNDYSGSLSIQAAGIRIPRPVAAAVGAALGFALTLWLNSGGLGGKFRSAIGDLLRFRHDDLRVDGERAAFVGLIKASTARRRHTGVVSGLRCVRAAPLPPRARVYLCELREAIGETGIA